MFNVKVLAHTPVGGVSGFLFDMPEQEASCVAQRNQIQTQVHLLNYVVLFGEDGKEILLPGALIQRSVLTFEIVRVDNAA